MLAWQTECLQLPALKRRQNLVLALPTSGGKTLVAEILVLKELLCQGRNALFVLPYVAIVQEKVRTPALPERTLCNHIGPPRDPMLVGSNPAGVNFLQRVCNKLPFLVKLVGSFTLAHRLRPVKELPARMACKLRCVRSLSPLAVALGFLVEEYAAGKGCYPPRRRRWKRTVYVATIEKAMGLVSSLTETDRLGEVGLAVVDELHLVGETGGRGANLEILLTKLLFSAGNVPVRSRPVVPVDLHVVGMSATIGNLGEVATFLQADSFCRNFRPVELREYIKLEDQVFSINWDARCPDELLTLSRRLEPKTQNSDIISMHYNRYGPVGVEHVGVTRRNRDRVAVHRVSERVEEDGDIGATTDNTLWYCPQTNSDIDPDSIGSLVLEVVPEESVLVFCATKKNCENVALLICQTMSRKFQGHKMDEKKALYRALMVECKGSVCPTLRSTLPFGVAYHHSGLMGGERRLLEEAFVSGTICCICCTSTLAAGVNLPAKRVILRSPYVGREFVTMSRYKQMVGRAGRAGMGSGLGESILVCKSTDIDKVRELVHSSMDQCVSSLAHGDASGMRSLLLSAIGQGVATSLAELHRLVKRTLLSVQNMFLTELLCTWQATRLGVDMKALVDSTLVGLFREGALRLRNQQADVSVCLSGDNVSQTSKKLRLHQDTPLSVSRLGRAAIRGCMDLKKARLLYEDLLQAQASLVLLTCLHLLYLVTPYDLVDQITPSPSVYFNSYNKLGVQDQQCARVLGITEVCMVRIVKGHTHRGVPERVIKRFYLTLMLSELWQQSSVWKVSVKYHVTRGFVQNLMSSSAAFAACVMRFCEELEEFWAFKDLLVNFSRRLSHCCTQELLPLMELPAVKRVGTEY
uniref:Helicase POLQ-like n=1 Tax=Timema douglasi TaxID=61478 RepID=A0A7R8VUH0_TIMDO|nr:unnamed protein product [Timema douglasi]